MNYYRNYFLANRLLKNEYSLDKCQKLKVVNGIEFEIEMKGIDKVEQHYLPNIQKLPEVKEIYDRLKLREIFELQRCKNLEEEAQSDPEMSWLKGKTLDEKFDYFLQRKKDDKFLEILDKIPKGKSNHSCLALLNEQ